MNESDSGYSERFFQALRRGRLPWYLSAAGSAASIIWIYVMLPIAMLSWRYRRVHRGLRAHACDGAANGPGSKSLTSCLCRQEQHDSPTFRSWAARMGQPHEMHRKQWEFCFIAQALHERGMLRPGARGLGFAVGQEPLPALFASYGCSIVASDLAEGAARDAGWVETSQHASSLEALNGRGLCPPDRFRDLTQFRVVDMNAIPADLHGFDFLWSACALEHLGSIENGEQFIHRAMECLKPGGVAVHTTEFNVSFEKYTPKKGPTVVFRRRDIERIAATLRDDHHEINLDLREGDLPFDRFVDVPPYKHPFLKLLLFSRLRGCVSTSIGLIIRKASGEGVGEKQGSKTKVYR
jgi:2-polyprenyl-3-methyl-5-hydroxy-6-metoxy-1,4-benzoquinol methylase